MRCTPRSGIRPDRDGPAGGHAGADRAVQCRPAGQGRGRPRTDLRGPTVFTNRGGIDVKDVSPTIEVRRAERLGPANESVHLHSGGGRAEPAARQEVHGDGSRRRRAHAPATSPAPRIQEEPVHSPRPGPEEYLAQLGAGARSVVRYEVDGVPVDQRSPTRSKPTCRTATTRACWRSFPRIGVTVTQRTRWLSGTSSKRSP